MVPVLFIIVAINTRNLQGPYHQAYFIDPSYVYLLNSLNIVNDELPGHTDHPGTTVQLLGGLVLKANVLIGEIKGKKIKITNKVLRNPERYINQISNVLIFILVISVFLFGLQVYRATKHLGLAIIAQMFPLTFTSLLTNLPRIQPEPLLVACTYLLAAILVPFATDTTNNTSSPLRAFMAGVIVAIGVVTKVTFAPLVLFLFVFYGNKAKLSAALAFICTISILTIPIWDSIPLVVNWLVGIMMHSGHYGHGEVGLPAASDLLSNSIRLLRAAPVIFVLIPLLVVSLFTAKKDAENSRITRLFAISLLVSFSCLVITIKHCGIRYLMPVMGLSSFFIFILAAPLSRKNLNIFICISSIICTLLLYKSTKESKASLVKFQKRHNEHSWLQKIAHQYGCRTASYYRSSSPKYALRFGNDFSRNIYNSDLMDLYPENLSYNIWEKRFYNFNGALSHSEVDDLLGQSTPVCLLGTVQLPFNGQPRVKILEKKGQSVLYQFLGFDEQNNQQN